MKIETEIQGIKTSYSLIRNRDRSITVKVPFLSESSGKIKFKKIKVSTNCNEILQCFAQHHEDGFSSFDIVQLLRMR